MARNRNKLIMKKRMMALAMTGILSLGLLSGCGSNNYTYSYKDASKLSSFSIESHKAQAGVVPLFASDLCVTPGDVGKNSVKLEGEELSAALFDVSGHEVLYGDRIYEQMAPASITKVMTALLALKYSDPSDEIIVSPVATSITEAGATMCGLKTGDSLTMDQALHALLLHSANDAALAIAEHVGGTVDHFCEMMNEEARRLGATSTHFYNPHGLTQDGHMTTAYDLYLIFNEAIKYNRFTQIISLDSYQTTYKDRNGNDKTFDFKSTNLFLRGDYKSPESVTVAGGKTGTTKAAGNCLILLSRDSAGNPYISVILHSDNRDQLYTNMTSLLEKVK